MAEITVGLAPRKGGFYDPLTNTYITLAKPVQKVSFDETKPELLKRITHAILCKEPALVLYEGTLPQASIEAWEEQFKHLFQSKTIHERKLDGTMTSRNTHSQAIDRAEQLKAGDADLPNAKSAPADEAEVAVAAAEVSAESEAVEEAKPAARKSKAARNAE